MAAVGCGLRIGRVPIVTDVSILPILGHRPLRVDAANFVLDLPVQVVFHGLAVVKPGAGPRRGRLAGIVRVLLSRRRRQLACFHITLAFNS